MKIISNANTTDTGKIEQPGTRGTAARPKAGGQASAGQGDSVQISDLSSRLSAIESASDGAFDASRVDAIKGAIRDGSLKVNPEVVADRLIASVRELLSGKS